jgi:hypothetical protein
MNKLRTVLEDEIERLLAALDALVGDPDLEPDDPPEENGDLEPSSYGCDVG